MKKLISIIAILFLLGSCEKSIDFNGQKTDPITIVNGLLNPDSIFRVSVTKSKHITDTNPIPKVTNARVEVYQGNSLLEELNHTGQGIYTGFSKPVVGELYTLKLTNDKDALETQATIPLPVVIDEVTASSNNNVNAENMFELSLTFTDPPQIENYYRITIHHDQLGDSDQASSLYLSSNDLIIRSVFGQDDGLDNTPDNEYLIFNDRLIDGKNYKLQLSFSDSEFYEGYDDQNSNYYKNYKLRLHSISKDFYLYLKSRNLESWVADDPFSEPVPVFSNIIGGGGVLGAYSTSFSSVSLSIDN